MTRDLEPFRIAVPQAALEDLAGRLRRARLPGAPARAGWDYGIDPDYLERLVEYWRSDYDWRAVEARLVRRTDLPAGGHFIAYERPGEFVEDVRAFFRGFRGAVRRDRSR